METGLGVVKLEAGIGAILKVGWGNGMGQRSICWARLEGLSGLAAGGEEDEAISCSHACAWSCYGVGVPMAERRTSLKSGSE